MPFLPPTELSTCDKSVVGIKINLIPNQNLFNTPVTEHLVVLDIVE